MCYKKISKEEFHRLLNLGEDKVVSSRSKDREAVWVGRHSSEIFGRVLMESQDFNEYEYEIYQCQ